MSYIIMILTGFLLAAISADAMLTRDAIKRSDGKIIEANKLMVWFMKKDWRAALVSILVGAAVVFASHAFIVSGAWYLAIPYFLVGIWFRGRIVIGNYRLNVKLME